MPVHGQAPSRRWVRPPTRSDRPIDRIAPGHRRCFAAEYFVLLLFPKAARPALRKGFLAAVGSSVGAIGVGAVLGLEFIDRKQVSLVPQVYSGALVCLHHLLNELLLSILYRQISLDSQIATDSWPASIFPLGFRYCSSPVACR